MNPLYPDSNFQEIRSKMYALRHNFFDKMDKYLLDFDSILTDRNIDVVWAKDEDSIINAINQFTLSKSIETVVIDSNIDCEKYIKGNFNIINPSDFENSNNDADLLIVDSDFAVCDSGSLVFFDRATKNCFNKTKNLFVIVNIDQVIASLQDLSLFISLKTQSNSDIFPNDVKIINAKPTYNYPISSIYSTEQTSQEINLTVVLYLNDIEDLIFSEDLLPALYCIHCGKCLEVCPVAQADEALSPIDIIKLNSLDKHNRAQHIFKHTTLCGACDNVCPVKIPLKKMMLFEMQASNMAVNPSKSKQLANIFSKRSSLNKFNNKFLKFFFNRRFFGQNKMLYNYFSNNQTDFFNVNFNPPHEDNPNEILKDSDFE